MAAIDYRGDFWYNLTEYDKFAYNGKITFFSLNSDRISIYNSTILKIKILGLIYE